MKVIGFDGKEYTWSLKQRKVGKPSQLHLLARQVLHSIFKFNDIFEEVNLPGSRYMIGHILVADFAVPQRYLIVEVQGEQHYKYSSFFHQNEQDFLMAKRRDAKKREWCAINMFDLIELPYNENADEWARRINDRR